MHNVLSKVKNFFAVNKRAVIIVLIITALDRITKVFALEFLAPDGSVKIFKYFYLTYLENTGMAFGLFQNGNLPLIFVMAVVIVFILASWRELTSMRPPWGYIGTVLILAGAISNLYDRIVLGYVVDFMDLKVWPVFNVADSAVCVGAALLGVAMFFDTGKQKGA